MTDVHSLIGSAEVFGGGTYFQPGLYPVVFVDAIKMIKNRDNHDVMVVECKIIQSEVPEQPRGTEASALANLTKHGKSAASNARKWLAQIAGVEPDAVDADGSKAATSSDNPFHGTLVTVRGRNIKTREKGNDFTVIDFQRLPDEMQAQARQLYSDAGFGDF